jgi:uncharacterized repeat protein (TIGR02543 family)
MKHAILRRAALILAIAASLSSCTNFFHRDSHKAAGGASLKVALRGAASGGRTILPPATNLADLSYDLSLTNGPSGAADINMTGLASTALSVSNLATGNWTLAITGKKGLSSVYMGTGAVTIVDGANSITLQLNPMKVSTGGMDVTITWPQGAADEVVLYFTNNVADIETKPAADLLGSGISSNFAGATPSVNVVKTGIASGDWYLVADIKKSGAIAASVIELVRIYDNQTSAGTVNIAAADMGTAPAAPGNATFNFSALPGQTLFAWTDNSNTETGYRIYQDGVLLAGMPVAANMVSYACSALSPTSTYTVSSFNAFGESAKASCVAADTLQVMFMEANQALVFPTAQTLAFGDPLPIGPSDPRLQGLAGWSWYVDGVKQSGTSSTFTFNPTGSLGWGQYVISASVTDNGALVSGSMGATINPPPGTTSGWSVTYSRQYAQSGDVPVDTNIYSSGPNVTVLGNTGNLTRASYTFAGWTDDPAGTGTLYTPGQTYAIGADVTFYPKWNSVTAFSGGDGSLAAPYLVSNAEQLRLVRYFPDKNFQQTADIDLAGDPGWVPIGSQAARFTGSYVAFSGTAVIRNLRIAYPTTDRVGLFGATQGATISVIMLVDASVNARDYQAVGALVGDGQATTVSKCGVTGFVGGTGAVAGNIGGLVGRLDGSSVLSQSYSAASVAGLGAVGGLIGSNEGNMGDCYSTGAVTALPGASFAGVFAGYLGGVANHCYTTGLINSTGWSFSGYTGGSANNCLFNGDNSGTANLGTSGTAADTASMLAVAAYSGWDTGSAWTISAGSYPSLQWQGGSNLTGLLATQKYVMPMQGSYSLPIRSPATIVVKTWGGGGGGSPSNVGAGGGYSRSAFSAAAGERIFWTVGVGGNTAPNYAGPALGGARAGTGGAGGAASVVALYNGSTTYTLQACAGGAGGPADGLAGGPGGGSTGNLGAAFSGVDTPAGSGIGGIADPANAAGLPPALSGSNMSISGPSFVGLGGNGAAAPNAGSGGGGGGYGGGAASGFDSYYYGGDGGAGYATGAGSLTASGMADRAANPNDTDYVPGSGNGGKKAASGNDGLVVITVTY